MAGNPERRSTATSSPRAHQAPKSAIVEGLVVDLDANGDVVGIDIDHTSRKLDLSRIETVALPAASAAE
jgi:uncharacterized protein YuzE